MKFKIDISLICDVDVYGLDGDDDHIRIAQELGTRIIKSGRIPILSSEIKDLDVVPCDWIAR